MKSKISFLVFILVAMTITAKAQTATFENDKGCVVEAEKRLKGITLLITDENQKTAMVSVLDDLSSGDITAFCRAAEVEKNGKIVKLHCDKNEDPGRYSTRGQATIDFNNGLSSVAVKGEYKALFGWKTDTNIICENLRLKK